MPLLLYMRRETDEGVLKLLGALFATTVAVAPASERLLPEEGAKLIVSVGAALFLTGSINLYLGRRGPSLCHTTIAGIASTVAMFSIALATSALYARDPVTWPIVLPTSGAVAAGASVALAQKKYVIAVALSPSLIMSAVLSIVVAVH